ncbi:hypothetical protein BgiMline_035073, partial [Biomphalaria glabrata]
FMPLSFKTCAVQGKRSERDGGGVGREARNGGHETHTQTGNMNNIRRADNNVSSSFCLKETVLND